MKRINQEKRTELDNTAGRIIAISFPPIHQQTLMFSIYYSSISQADASANYLVPFNEATNTSLMKKPLYIAHLGAPTASGCRKH